MGLHFILSFACSVVIVEIVVLFFLSICEMEKNITECIREKANSKTRTIKENTEKIYSPSLCISLLLLCYKRCHSRFYSEHLFFVENNHLRFVLYCIKLRQLVSGNHHIFFVFCYLFLFRLCVGGNCRPLRDELGKYLTGSWSSTVLYTFPAAVQITASPTMMWGGPSKDAINSTDRCKPKKVLALCQPYWISWWLLIHTQTPFQAMRGSCCTNWKARILCNNCRLFLFWKRSGICCGHPFDGIHGNLIFPFYTCTSSWSTTHRLHICWLIRSRREESLLLYS